MADRDLPDSEDGRIERAIEHLLALKENPGWKILMARLEADAAHARDELVVADFNDPKAIATLQSVAQMVDYFTNLPDELIQTAVNEEEVAEGEMEEVEDDG